MRIVKDIKCPGSMTMSRDLLWTHLTLFSLCVCMTMCLVLNTPECTYDFISVVWRHKLEKRKQRFGFSIIQTSFHCPLGVTLEVKLLSIEDHHEITTHHPQSKVDCFSPQQLRVQEQSSDEFILPLPGLLMALPY